MIKTLIRVMSMSDGARASPIYPLPTDDVVALAGFGWARVGGRLPAGSKPPKLCAKPSISELKRAGLEVYLHHATPNEESHDTCPYNVMYLAFTGLF